MPALRISFATLIMASLASADELKFLRFKEQQHVEIEKSRGVIDYSKSFTIELWFRLDPDHLKSQYLAGDEAWKGMSDQLPVEKTRGWVLRTSAIEGSNKRSIGFTFAVDQKGVGDWVDVVTPQRRIGDPKEWHHIAVSRNGDLLQLFWNGKSEARQSMKGLTVREAPTNLFLGPRKFAWSDRSFVGDIKGFRVSSKARSPKPEENWIKDDSTLILLNFQSGDETRIPDLSGSKRHGTLNGPVWKSE